MNGTLAEIRLYAGNVAPANWMSCDGQLLSVKEYPELFALLGHTFGGSGGKDFALPDLIGRTAIGAGGGRDSLDTKLGNKIGSATAILEVANLPAHNHAITGNVTPQACSNGPLGTDGTGRYIGPGNFYTPNEELVSMAPIPADGLKMDMTGGGKPFSLMQPSLGLHYIICVRGAVTEIEMAASPLVEKGKR